VGPLVTNIQAKIVEVFAYHTDRRSKELEIDFSDATSEVFDEALGCLAAEVEDGAAIGESVRVAEGLRALAEFGAYAPQNERERCVTALLEHAHGLLSFGRRPAIEPAESSSAMTSPSAETRGDDNVTRVAELAWGEDADGRRTPILPGPPSRGGLRLGG